MRRAVFLVLAFFVFAAQADECSDALSEINNKTLAAVQTKRLRERHASLLEKTKALQELAPLTSKQRAAFRAEIRNFVVSFIDEFKKLPTEVSRSMMQLWIETSLKKFGYLPGFDDEDPGYKNLAELDKDIIEGRPWNFMNTYFNSQTGLEAILYAYDLKDYDKTTLTLVEVGLAGLFDSLITREYALRFIRTRPDVPRPLSRSTVHGAIDRLEKQVRDSLIEESP